jgi:hypothetical protein
MAAPDDVSEEKAFELGRWGTRFVRSDTEKRYVEWRFQRSIPVRRVAQLVAAGFWVSFSLLSAALGYGEAALISAVVVSPVLAAMFITLRSGSMRAANLTALVAFAVVGLLGVVLGVGYLGNALHASLVGGLVLACYFQFGSSHAAPRNTALAVATWLVTALIALGLMFRRGELGLAAAITEAWILLISFGMAVLMAVAADGARRRAFRQECVIEAQKETIARERARSEELFERELSHQVAERSRELGAALARTDATLDVRRITPGERFAERYRVVSALGAGGMGVVHEVERVTDGRRLALKAVVGEVSGSSAARFAREAEIGARVHHPNLVSIVDVGISAGVPYLVMELVLGGSLENERARFGDVEWALPIIRQIAEGLAALHDAGVVHRDLKPSNVLLAEGVAKISDFGISRFGKIEEGASTDPNAATMAVAPKPHAGLVTGTGVILGTPLYMAPEAARGGRALAASADVFALGILAYEMLSGRPPFSVPAFVLALSAQPTPVPPPLNRRGIDRDLAALVLECLAGDPDRRPRVRALLAALR